MPSARSLFTGGYDVREYAMVVFGGAGPSFHGADAVHHHMTNTRGTDPEVLEHRYQVRLDRYAIRKGSGGQGKWKGGKGYIGSLPFWSRLNLRC